MDAYFFSFLYSPLSAEKMVSFRTLNYLTRASLTERCTPDCFPFWFHFRRHLISVTDWQSFSSFWAGKLQANQRKKLSVFVAQVRTSCPQKWAKGFSICCDFKSYSQISIEFGTMLQQSMLWTVCVKTVHFTWRAYTHYLVMLWETIFFFKILQFPVYFSNNSRFT